MLIARKMLEDSLRLTITTPVTPTTDPGGLHGRALLKRALTYVPSSVLPAALTLVTSMVFTRIFSAAAFGTYSLFLVIATPVKLILTSWVSQATSKFVPQAQTEEGRLHTKEALAVAVVIALSCESVLGLTSLLLFTRLLTDQNQSYLTPMVAFVIVSSIFDALTTLLTAEHRAREYTAFRVTDSVLTLIFRLLMVSAVVRMDLTLMFWSVAISNGLLVPVLWRRSGMPRARRLRALMASPQARRTVRSFAAFGLPMTIWYLSSVLLDVADRFVIGAFAGPASVGIYDANYRLIFGTAFLMVVPVTVTLHPYLMSISGAGDSHRIGVVIGSIVENLLLVGSVAVGLAFLFSRDVATLLLGPQFREGHVIMPVVLAGVLFYNIGLFAHKPFEVIGRPGPMVMINLTAAAVNVGLNIVLVPLFGYVGSAYATLASYALYAAWVGLRGRRIFLWRLDLRRIAIYLAGTILAVAGIRALRAALHSLPGWVGLFISLAVSGLGAGCSLMYLIRHRSPEMSVRSEPPMDPDCT